MTNENVFENAGRVLFTRDRIKSLEKELNSAGINMPADSFAGYIGLNVLILTIFLTLLIVLYQPTSELMVNLFHSFVPVLEPVIPLLVLIASFITVYLATMALVSSYLLMKTDNRRNKLEAILPDFLSLVASNIKAGMTLDQAMWYSAKPEFGLLSQEVKALIKSSYSGESLEDTLDRLGERFDSKIFKRTLLLLKQATATGGELTEVLERTSEDVRNTIIMKKEIAASLVLYEIFVLFAAIVGTPFLFAVASKLVAVFEKIAPLASSTGGGSTAGAGGVFTVFSNMKFAGPVISSSDFFWFSIPTILVTALISSFMVSVIRTGSKSQGMQYFPFVLVLSYLVYWIVMNVVESIFTSIG
ncbi:Type II secretion system (T2SS), protein F [Candidatus Bilamarchaeum dharawalense]|uniref:Type II secretion system (T2SS), protein F n=1 Tax=Candidatus Bilamarchaeum dharawalense TaxID=2885759 RepID=A0A5E4LNB4_9ARCH|nr:Type II secretion system (T2SS), protein F [Candidatus Bilamarchaeum dharawalense]